jgi:serine O-acetyltransferase
MWQDICRDYRAYKKPLLAQGFWALAIHRYGMTINRISNRVLRLPFAIVHRILIKLSEVFLGIYIGPHVQIGARCVIEHFGAIIIHSDVKIGDDVRIRQCVTIGNKSIDEPNEVPTIGNNVDIGAGAKILGKIAIGDRTAIGANAVVLCDVPPDSVAVGVPARILPRKIATPRARREVAG